MAKFFYNFEDALPSVNTLPNGFGRLTPDGLDTVDFRQEFYRSPRGLGVVQMNALTSATNPNFTYGFVFGQSGLSTTDAEVLVALTQSKYTGGGYSNDGPSFFFRTNNQPSLSLAHVGTAGTMGSTGSFFRQTKNGVAGPDITNFTSVTRANGKVWFRAKCSGNVFSLKSWEDGTSEPTAAQFSVTNTSPDPLTEPGGVFFGLPGATGKGYMSNSGTEYVIHQLSFGTGVDAAPMTSVRTISGTLKTPTGTPAQGYILRCYSQTTGALLKEVLSDAVTGSFEFSLTKNDQVYCIALDQLGNTWKAPILDRLIPV